MQILIIGESQVHPARRLAGTNLPDVEFKPVSDLHVYDLIKWRRVILDVSAVQVLERTLSKGWRSLGKAVSFDRRINLKKSGAIRTYLTIGVEIGTKSHR